jgi:5'-nucleotidase (lipoprotein e(P4) family)
MKRSVTVVLLGLCLATHPYAFAQTPPATPCVTVCPTPPPPPPRPPDASRGLETKYVRDSAEYATLCREVYRVATNAVTGATHTGTWGVILDIDETTLDNSAYQLERGAYGLSFDDASWAAWIARKEAGSVPGVEGFVNAVRAAGGKVVYITDRNTSYAPSGGPPTDLVAPTRENLERNHLWNSADLLCPKTGGSDTKAMRRKAVATGVGACSWSGVSVSVVAFVGDQMGDFPAAGEGFTGAGADDQFGRSFFLLPNPMYGKWTNGVTRVSGSFP